MIQLGQYSLPIHGRVGCSVCHEKKDACFDQTTTEDGEWRITWNPLAWGNPLAEVAILGFSKGPTQAGALTSTAHDMIAFKGGRLALGKILAHVGLLAKGDDASLRTAVDRAISDKEGRFHFGSLVRCTVERKSGAEWTGTGGGMLDRFVNSPFGAKVATRCTSTFLGNLAPDTKLVIMLGMGTRGNYIVESKRLFARSRPGNWHSINEVSYTDGKIVVVHVEHFKSQGAHIPDWLSEERTTRGRLGLLAREAVQQAL